MSAPTLQPLDINAPLGTPASEWAQQTVEAIDPNATTGLVTDAHGNPTGDHAASALSGAPGGGINADKTHAHLDAIASQAPGGVGESAAANGGPSTGLVTDAQGNPTGVHSASAYDGAPGPGINSNKTVEQMDAVSGNAPEATAPIPFKTESAPERPPRLFTDAQGNPTIDPALSALRGIPGGTPGESPSVASTPGVQLPGGWIRSAGSRQQSMAAPQTTLYEDVSAALGTVGQAAFSALPASVIGNLSNNPDQGGANPTQNGTASAPAANAEDTKASSSPPRSSSPGLLSRAQGMLSGFLARPASPAPKLPAPDAPTTTGSGEGSSENPALVGGGAVAQTANEIGDKVASGQDLGGHEPKGVLDEDRNKLAALGMDKAFDQAGRGKRLEDGEKSATSPGMPNTAAQFLDAGVPTPDPSKPPHDPGLSGSVFPIMADDPKKNKSKVTSPGTGKSPSSPTNATSPTSAANTKALTSAGMGSTLSPDLDVQEAARNSNQDFTTAIPQAGGNLDDSDRPAPTVTKVFDSGVLSRLLDARDVVAAPFAGSRAPRESDELASPGSLAKDALPSSLGKGTAGIDQANKRSVNPEGIRTTANSHTAHTRLAPPREEGTHVGGTGVEGVTSPSKGSDVKSADEVREAKNPDATTGAKSPETETGNGTHVPGVSTLGEGEGKVVADEKSKISAAEAGNGTATGEKDHVKESKGVSRLWSRRASGDSRRRGSVDEASGKSPNSTRRMKSPSRSRFNEEPSGGSDSNSTPASPTSSRFKVPLKDKIKGEFKIISGKVSRNEAKVEQGIALKTGHTSH